MNTKALLGLLVALCAVAGGCAPKPRVPTAGLDQPLNRWVVIAPHPDDEALTASGVLLNAVRAGAGVAVVIMTNGDWACIHDGIRRERETLAGLSALGLSEERVYFLGYPDGGLSRLGRAPLAVNRIVDGACAFGNTTYGRHGFGRHDYHTAHFGSAATYTRENAVSDLASLLIELRPTDVVISHPADTHPDHAAAYALFRSALDRMPNAPRVHRAMVHEGHCWPTGPERGDPCPAGRIEPNQPVPHLSWGLRGYEPGEHLAVPASCRSRDRQLNPKVRAIAAHVSQTRNAWDSYLFSFARSDEVFFPESLRKTDGHWQHFPAAGLNAATRTLRLHIGEPCCSVPLRAPLTLSASFLPPPHTELGRISRIVIEDRTGSYVWTLDADHLQATLARTFEAHALEVLHEWPLPHDLWGQGEAEPIVFAIEPRPEDGVTELALRIRDELAGVAVDVNPTLQGERIALTNVMTVNDELLVNGASGKGLHGAP